MPKPTDSDSRLAQRCRQGDVEAYRALFDRFEQPLLRLGLGMLGQQQDAEDAVQDAFLRLYRSMSRFEERAAIGTYLFRIMVNVCYDRLRTRRRQLTPVEVIKETSHTPQDALRVDLERHIAALPERMRACFVMFAVEGFQQREIAEVLELSVGTVKAHVHEAKKRLRATLFRS